MCHHLSWLRKLTDDLQASLILNIQRGNLGLGHPSPRGYELAKFARSFQKKDRADHQRRVEMRIVKITRQMTKMQQERDRLIGRTISSGCNRCAWTRCCNQLKRHLNMDRIEAECLRDILKSKGETRT